MQMPEHKFIEDPTNSLHLRYFTYVIHVQYLTSVAHKSFTMTHDNGV